MPRPPPSALDLSRAALRGQLRGVLREKADLQAALLYLSDLERLGLVEEVAEQALPRDAA